MFDSSCIDLGSVVFIICVIISAFILLYPTNRNYKIQKKSVPNKNKDYKEVCVGCNREVERYEHTRFTSCFHDFDCYVYQMNRRFTPKEEHIKKIPITEWEELKNKLQLEKEAKKEKEEKMKKAVKPKFKKGQLVKHKLGGKCIVYGIKKLIVDDQVHVLYDVKRVSSSSDRAFDTLIVNEFELVK